MTGGNVGHELDCGVEQTRRDLGNRCMKHLTSSRMGGEYDPTEKQREAASRALVK